MTKDQLTAILALEKRVYAMRKEMYEIQFDLACITAGSLHELSIEDILSMPDGYLVPFPEEKE